MNDAVSKTPSLDEQMATFKGFTSVEGTVRPETDAERGVQSGEGSTKTAPAAGKASASAQDRLSAALKPGKKAAPAAENDDDDDSDAGADENTGETGDQNQQQGQQPPAKAVKDPQQRINQAVKRQRTAERERDAARAEMRTLSERLARLEGAVSTGGARQPLTNQNQQTNNASGGTPPNPASYEYGDLDTRYIADLARFEARQAFRAEQAQEQQRTQSTRASEQQAAKVESLRTFEAKGLEKYDDFDEVVIASANANEWPLTPTVGELVMESDHGPDVAYFLATHHDVAHRVAKMTPAKQAAWFGQQEALLSSQSADASTPKVPSQTKAPPLPAARIQGGGNRTQVSADTSDFAAFEAMATGNKH